MIADYLAAEALIIARLTAQVPELRAVLGAAELDGLAEAQQQTPNAQVLYEGDALPGAEGSRAGNAAAQVVLQRWLVIVCVRNRRDAKAGAGARQAAGPIVSKVIAALQGHQLSTDFRALRRITPPRSAPGYSAGFAYFPLAFEAQLMTQP